MHQLRKLIGIISLTMGMINIIMSIQLSRSSLLTMGMELISYHQLKMMLTTTTSLLLIMETLLMRKFMDLDYSLLYGTIEVTWYQSLPVNKVLVVPNSQQLSLSIRAMLAVVVTYTQLMHHHTPTSLITREVSLSIHQLWDTTTSPINSLRRQSSGTKKKCSRRSSMVIA